MTIEERMAIGPVTRDELLRCAAWLTDKAEQDQVQARRLADLGMGEAAERYKREALAKCQVAMFMLVEK